MLGVAALPACWGDDVEAKVKAKAARGADDAGREHADVLIVGGKLFDGTGAAAQRVDLAVRGERIVAIGALDAWTAEHRIDASGQVVCPGFIDLHSHSDSSILVGRTRNNRSYLTQGCSTIVTGNCGGGKIDVGRYFGRLASRGAGTNVAHLLPHGSIRRRAMGASVDRAPTSEERARMRKLFDKGMREGAFGMSTGLIYAPGSFAKTEELVDCATVVAGYGGIYVSHIRGEDSRLLGAVDEAIQIGERAGCPTHISHFKASVPRNWGKVRDAAARIEEARARGLRVSADQYPYVASSTSLAALVIPSKERAGTNADLVRRLRDPEHGKRIRGEIRDAFARRGGYDKVLIASYREDASWNGLSVAEAAQRAELDPVELVCRMQRSGRVGAVAFSMCDEDVEFVMKLPWVATASDGSSQVPSPVRPHPRSYGTFPRKVGRYAIEKRVLSLAAAIRSATSLPADILGLPHRGRLRVGAFADVLVFDPAEFRDHATFVEPHRYSTGVRYLLVNGRFAMRDGEVTGVLAGRPLRKKARDIVVAPGAAGR